MISNIWQLIINICLTFFHDIWLGGGVQLHPRNPAGYAYIQAPLKVEGPSNDKQVLGP